VKKKNLRGLRAALLLLIAQGLLPASSLADHIDEMIITASRDPGLLSVATDNIVAADVGRLIAQAPGMNLNSNGPLSGIPQYRGMFGSRIATTIDGTQVTPTGPNWMDTPLSYVDREQISTLEIYRGITPVSAAAESIGGAIVVRTKLGELKNAKHGIRGDVSVSGQSANEGYELSAQLSAKSQHQKISIAATTAHARDIAFAKGDITPTQYDKQRYDLGYAIGNTRHALQFQYTNTKTKDSGTPALPMDIELIAGDIYRMEYRFDGGSAWQVSANIYGSELDHEMNNFALRAAPAASRWRRNVVSSSNFGFKLNTAYKTKHGQWRAGLDGHSEEHDSDIENPNNAAFFVKNFNAAKREIFGVFFEREQHFGSQSRAEFGLRYNRVAMNAEDVDATPARMMPPAQALRDNFNSADRSAIDGNLDAVAKFWHQLDPQWTAHVSLAQKNRTPSYQERYLWLPLEATAGLADGFTYTGNLGLKPEQAHQLELGLDYSTAQFSASPRLFYSRVENYIQGTPLNVGPAVMFIGMMNSANNTSTPDPLQFNNVDALLYGFDMDWRWSLTQQWSLSGLVSYARGKRNDSSSDNLYRISPPNTSMQLRYTAPNWSAAIESVLYAEQDDVSSTHQERVSSGYGIVNVSGSWGITSQLNLTAGVDNVLDRDYRPHLNGYNRASNPDIAARERLPGTGINLFTRLRYTF